MFEQLKGLEESKDSSQDYNLLLKNLISSVAEKLYNIGNKNFDTVITDILKEIGLCSNSVRSSLFILSEDSNNISNTHEWCKNPEDSQIDLLQNIPFKTFGYYMTLLENLQNVIIGKIEDLPKDAIGEREWIKKYGFRPLLFVPLIYNNSLYGTIGIYGEIGESREWPEVFIAALQYISHDIILLFENRRSQQHLRLFIDNITDVIWTTDLNLNTTYVSPSVEKLTGYSVEEYKALPLRKKFTPKSLEIIVKISKEHIELENTINSNYNPLYTLEVEEYHKNRSIIPCEVTINPLRDDKGKIIGFIGATREISRRKKAEEALKESELKYRILFESANDVIFLMDGPIFIDVNDYVCKIFGFNKKSEVIGLTLWDLSPLKQPDGRLTIEKGKELLEKCLNGEPQRFYWKYKKTDGTTFDVHISLNRIILKNKYFIQAIVRDLTEQIKAREELEISEKKYRELFNHMSSGVAVYEAINDGEDFIFKDFNIAGQKMEKVREEDVIGKSVKDCFPGIIEFGLFDIFKKVWKTGKPEHHPINLYKDKRIMGWKENYVYKLPSGEIVAVYNDVTEKKIAEEALRESEERYRKMITNLDIGYYIIKIDGEIIFHNPAAVRIMGYDEGSDITGLNVKSFWESSEDLIEYIKHLKKKGENKNFIISAVRVDGKKIFLQVNAHLVEDELGVFSTIEGTISDVTQKMELENTLKEQNKTLQEINKFKEELFSRTSHELKTPLISIRGFAELLLESYSNSSDERLITALREIKHGCIRMENTIKKLLFSSKLKKERIILKLNREDISEQLIAVIEELKGAAQMRGHEIELDIEPDLFIKVDKEKMHEAFSNLLINSIKFTPKNGRIWVKAKKKEDFIIISIKDNGIGIIAEEKDRLFKEFGKIERFGKGFDVQIEGSGLGLFITKKIIELHKGEIWVESEGRNKGSEFFIKLPMN
ncbi:MAG: sensor histidine kinase [Promethearchaeota archaeon]